jgi:hypothetical protein
MEAEYMTYTAVDEAAGVALENFDAQPLRLTGLKREASHVNSTF